MKEKRKEKRIDLKLNPRNMSHRVAITKLENYDQSYFSSLTDYIVHAITAYEEPVPVTKSELRKVIREELSSLITNNVSVVVPEGKDSDRSENSEKRINLMSGYQEKVEAEEMSLSELSADTEEEENPEKEISLDPSTIDFFDELGI